MTKHVGRRGTATVELCVCLPLLVLIVVGSIETCSLIYLSETLSVTSYEAGRVLAMPNGTTEQADRRAKEILKSRGIANATVTSIPGNAASLDPGTEFRVVVAAPAHTNSLVPGFLFANRQLQAAVTFVKE
ncbi:MAG: TadE/TadG family type IV pilus assembly protein [Planctomycetota bacterium]|nr:TadE/TadG family type IV pilus assembly protein [Planctomycetota bacterium]